MNPVLIAVLLLTGTGLLASVILVIASKLMYVPVDETANEIAKALPGANCGACGYAGCSDYAAAVASKKAAPNLCVPGGADAAEKVSAIIGEDAGEIIPMVAAVACHGNYDNTRDKYRYAGVKSCAASNMLHAGRSECAYGCIGFGDCVSACKFDAISVENGVAIINYAVCKGCGACVAKCPKGIIKLVPRTTRSLVLCSNHDKGAKTRKTCVSGCIGCMKCEKVCPNGAIKVDNNCAIIDFSKCGGCGECMRACPVHAPKIGDED